LTLFSSGRILAAMVHCHCPSHRFGNGISMEAQCVMAKPFAELPALAVAGIAPKRFPAGTILQLRRTFPNGHR
jgi:hypothetical protein